MTASLETLVVAAYIFADGVAIPRPRPEGKMVGYDLVDPKPGEERQAVLERAAAHPGSVLFCDGGFSGLEYERQMELISVELVTPERHQLVARRPAEIAKARLRLVIESVFSNLERQMRLSDDLAKTIGGLAQRIAQRLLALTIGILVNLLAGRPARALAAHDGRQTHISPLGRNRRVRSSSRPTERSSSAAVTSRG